MMARQTLEEKTMRGPKKSSVFAALLLMVLILLGANAALADLRVSFVVPSSVTAGASFPITVNVKNNSEDPQSAPVVFNRVAAGYALADMKIKGPYEVDTASHSVGPQQTISFTFNFRINYGTGSIVPVAVFFAQDSYQGDNMKGEGIIGIKVNPPSAN
jgi:hypothetical protein